MLPIQYGQNTRQSFFESVDTIVQDYHETNRLLQSGEKIDNTFFGGSTVYPKSFIFLLSSSTPEVKINKITIEILPEESYVSTAVGFVEGLPLIGSLVAVIGVAYHLFGMLACLFTFSSAIEQYEAAKQKFQLADNSSTRAELEATATHLFNQAVDYMVHHNKFAWSFISLFPLFKPITIISLGLAHSFAHDPAEKKACCAPKINLTV